MSRYVAGGAGGFNLLRQWRKNLSTKAKEASPKASLFDSVLRNTNLGAQRGFTRAYSSVFKTRMMAVTTPPTSNSSTGSTSYGV